MGIRLLLTPRDIVIFVGPNNAGKSAALRELEEYIGPQIPRTVIRSVALRRTGTIEEVRAFVELNARKQGDPRDFQYAGFRFSVQTSQIEHAWRNDLAQLRGLFCLRIPTETRITDSNPASAIAVLDSQPSHPMHLLFNDERIELRLSGYFRRAFNEDLILFRFGGASWPLLVGERLIPQKGEDRISFAYIQRLRDVSVPLQSQGDGMRSFASVILHLLTPNTPSVLLLDEPEAFLHPPQARLLGEFIAKERPANSQLFIATHSPDVLQGLLNVASEHLRVVRIQRDGSINRAKELDKARAKEIGNDPLMKFTAVMSGLFHQRVIICEADADCMFYSSILDIPAVHGDPQPDVLFIQAGGKHRMAALAEALRALDVNVDVIADIDILNEEPCLERLVKALGGDWNDVVVDARPLKSAIEQHKPWLNASEVVKGIRSIIDRAPDAGEFPRNLRSEIESIFRKASPWDAIKDAGKAAIPSGQATQQYDRLHKNCCQRSLKTSH